MPKRVLILSLFFAYCLSKAQCPQLYNYLGNLSSTPQFISCTGGAYAMSVVSNTSWGAYTVSWGDASPNSVGASYTANSNTSITHTYAAATSTYPLVLTIPALNCTLTSLVVMELQTNAVISIPMGFPTYGCAPKTLTFQNTSTDVSSTTSFTFMFGDGTPPVVFGASNVNQLIAHTYTRNSVPSCAATASLFAKNYCNVSPSLSQYGPLQIYDVDAANIASDVTHCVPDNNFIFTNATNRNCLAQGNTFQRKEKWNFGNYWGMGHDSILNWSNWPPSSPVNITFPGIGQYTVQLLDSNLCGVDTAIQIVNIVPPPTASVVAPAGNLCQNASISFTNASTGGGNVFSWNFGDGGGFVSLGAGNKNHTYATPGTYTVRLVASISGANNSCSDTSKVVVTILTSPVSAFALSPAAGCNTLSVSFTNTSVGASTYTWTFGNSSTSNLQNPPAQNYLLTGTFIPTLVVTATTGCTHSSTGTVIVRPKPIPAFTQFAACVGAAVTFTNNSTPTSGVNSITSYTWNFGDLSSSSNSITPVHTYTAAGTYSVKLITSSAFCTDSLQQNITINIKPTADFIPTPTVGCPPLPVTFSNTSANALNYLWKYSGISATSTATTPSFSFSNTTQNFLNYTVTLIAGAGTCFDSTKKVISVRPKPVPSFTSNTITGCSPLVTTFTNTSLGIQSSQWNFGDGGTSPLQNPTHTYHNTGLFTQTVTVKLVVTNSVGCTDSTTKLMTVYPEALTVFSMVPASGCSPLHVNFISVPGVAVYTWNHGDGSPTYTTLTAHAWTYTNNSLSNQTAVVSLTAQTSNGCIGTGSGAVTIFYNPIANFTTNPGIGCSPLSVTLSNTSSGHSISNWNFGNGLTSNQTDPSSTFTNAAGAGQLSYSIKLKVGTVNSCFDSIVKPVILFPQPKAGFGLDTPACSPKTILFTSSSIGANSYNWDFGDGTQSSVTNSSTTHPFVNGTGANKTFLVRLTAISSNNCRDSVMIPMIVHPKPTFFISSKPDSGCSPLKVHFDSIKGVKQYQWKYDGISFGSEGDITNSFENKDPITKTINIELIARDIYTCADTAIKQVKIFPVPIARFSAKPLTVFIPNQPTFFTNESTPEFLYYKWSFGDGETSEEKSPSHKYAKAGEFQTNLIVTTDKGCVDTFDLPNKVMAMDETTVETPNAFTPNPSGPVGRKFDPQDTSNDIFHPNVKGTEKYQFSIYSRWGELLFDTKDPEEGWDGYYKGKLCTADVYIWKITATFIDGRSYNKTGDLLLLR